MSKSNLTQYLSEVTTCVSLMLYIPIYETAPLFLYKPIKFATYSLDQIGTFLRTYWLKTSYLDKFKPTMGFFNTNGGFSLA